MVPRLVLYLLLLLSNASGLVGYLTLGSYGYKGFCLMITL